MNSPIKQVFLIALLCLVSIKALAEQCGQHLVFGTPKADQVLCRDGYATGYSYQYKIPLWTAYYITSESVHGVNVKRQDKFKEDTEIPAQYRSTAKDYSRSGYDRGHQAGSATIDYSEEANAETFLYSNMTPQIAGFNRNMMGHKGAWGKAEGLVRKWVKSRGELYVISGAIVTPESDTIGNGVAVPSYFYKIIIDPQAAETIAFLFPHIADARDEIPNYIVSIDRLEEITGLDFLDRIDDHQEAYMERPYAPKVW